MPLPLLPWPFCVLTYPESTAELAMPMFWKFLDPKMELCRDAACHRRGLVVVVRAGGLESVRRMP